MYLVIMLIVVAVLVFYNEYHKTMNIAEVALLAVALLAIVRASFNYINIDKNGSLLEGFTSNTKKTNIKMSNKMKNNLEEVLESTNSEEYFDSETDKDIDNTTGETLLDRSSHTNNKKYKIKNNFNESIKESIKESGKVDSDAVSQINSLLGIKSEFADVSKNNTGTSLDSIFKPEIRIGKSARDYEDNYKQTVNWNLNQSLGLGVLTPNSIASSSADINASDGMTFENSMKPKNNLWKTDLDYMDTSMNWTQSLDDFNKGKWNPKLYGNASDYIDYYNPSAYGMSTPTNKSNFTSGKTSSQNKVNFENVPEATTLGENGETKKLCGAYDDLSLEQSGNLTVKNYTQAKKWVPGYTYVPPVYWDVPQRHRSVCNQAQPNSRKLTGLIDRGLPLNVLELNSDGTYADTEDDVSLTNVGSILPKFTYQEMPFSKPYV